MINIYPFQFSNLSNYHVFLFTNSQSQLHTTERSFKSVPGAFEERLLPFRCVPEVLRFLPVRPVVLPIHCLRYPSNGNGLTCRVKNHTKGRGYLKKTPQPQK